MSFASETVALIFGLAALVNGLVDALIAPLFEKFALDKFWLKYVAWIISGVVVWFTGANLFAAYIPAEAVGLILTAVIAGVGSNILHDVSDK